MRNLVTTPDALEFAIGVPTIVGEMMKKSSKLPFIYHTTGHSFYEEVDGKMDWQDIPSLSPQPLVQIEKSEYVLLQQYRRSFLTGLRQLSIHQQTTADKCGTLPLYAYTKAPTEPKPIDITNFLKAGGSVEVDLPAREDTYIFAGTCVLITWHEGMDDMDKDSLIIGTCLADCVKDQMDVKCSCYSNTWQNPCKFFAYWRLHCPHC